MGISILEQRQVMHGSDNDPVRRHDGIKGIKGSGMSG